MKYKKLINEASIKIEEDEVAKIERIVINKTGEEEIRFSWWKDNGVRFIRTPLDLTEENWLKLIEAGIEEEVFSDKFIKELRELLK